MPWVTCPAVTSTRPSPSVWLSPSASTGRTLRHTSAPRWWLVWWPEVSWSSSPAVSRASSPPATWRQRLRGPLPRWLQPDGSPGHRGRADRSSVCGVGQLLVDEGKQDGHVPRGVVGVGVHVVVAGDDVKPGPAV